MIASLRRFFSSWAEGLDEVERRWVQEEVRARNLERIAVLALVAGVLHVLHILLFEFVQPPPGSNLAMARLWRGELVALHATSALLVVLLGVAVRRRALRMAPELVTLLYILVGAALAAVDQRVTSSITPYMTLTVVLTVLLRLAPATVVSLQALGALGLLVGQVLRQPDPAIRLSNIVNGTAIAAAGATLGVVLSITEHREMRQRRLIQHQTRALELALERERALNERAEAANVAKTTFLGNIGHELRTPMNAILGLVRLTHDEVTEERHRAWLTTIERSGRGLLALLEDVLTTSRLEGGRLELFPKPCDPRLLAREVASALEAEVRAKGLEIRVSLAPEVPPAILADEVRLRQILFNLLGNAVKFTDAGRVELELSAARQEEPNTIALRIDVRDTGPGIAADDQQRIFEPFTQGTSTKKQQGAGLGLSICRRLVERMGGTIDVESALGCGSRFTVHLPEVPVTHQPTSSLSMRAISQHEDEERALPRSEVAALLPVVRGTLGAMRRVCGHQLRTDLLGPFADTLCESPAGRLRELGLRLRSAIGQFDVDAMRATLSEYDRLVEALERRTTA